MQAVHWQTGLSLSSIHVHTTWLMTVFHLASELTFALSQFLLVKSKHKWECKKCDIFYFLHQCLHLYHRSSHMFSCTQVCICVCVTHLNQLHVVLK